ncbi:sigma-70 family RNA polymerase sigma factor [Oceanobacillus sp. CAU 1775]
MKGFSFEEIVEQNERRIHYHLHKLRIQDPHQEFYQEGLIAMWSAYKKYQPDKGPLSTYFNFIIHRRLIDLIRKESRRINKETPMATEEEETLDRANYQNSTNTEPQKDIITEHLTDNSHLWMQIRELLTEKQWKWVQYYIIEDISLKEIAEKENVSVEAVKGWAKEARRKLRHPQAEKNIMELLEK